MKLIVAMYLLTVGLGAITVSHGADFLNHNYEQNKPSETISASSALRYHLKTSPKSLNKLFYTTRKGHAKDPVHHKVNIFPRSADEHVLMRAQQRPSIGFDFDQNLHHGVYRLGPNRNEFPLIVTDQHIIPRPHDEHTLMRSQQRPNIGFDFEQDLYHGIYRPGSNHNEFPQIVTDQHIIPPPHDEHTLMRSQERPNMDFSFDQDLNHGIYRPGSNRNEFRQIVIDQHIIPRPHDFVFQNLNTAGFNPGNFFITKPYKPVHTTYESKPNFGANSYTLPVGLKPPHIAQAALRPPISVLQENSIHFNRPNIDITNNQFQDGNSLAGKPSIDLKPTFVILSKNVFLGTRSGFPVRANPDQIVETLNGIRYDHGRDYHVTPDPVTIEINKEVPMNVHKTDSVSRPPYQALSANNIVQSEKPHVSTSLLATNKGTGALDSINPISLQSMGKPSTDNNGLGFHPLLSPYRQ